MHWPTTRRPADKKSRSQNRSCSSKKPAVVWLCASKGVVGEPGAPGRRCASSPRSSRPRVLVDHDPMKKRLSHSASRRSTLIRDGNSHGGNGHPSARRGGSTTVASWLYFAALGHGCDPCTDRR